MSRVNNVINIYNRNRIGIYAAALSSLIAGFAPALGLLVLPIMAVFLGSDPERSIYSPKFQRETAWILLALAAGEGFTGFAAGPVTSNIISRATLGLMTRGLGLELHLMLIDPLAIFFILHLSSGIGLALLRRGVKWAPLYKVVIPMILILLFAIIIYMDALFFA